MNQKPTLDEVFPILARIESVPLAECKAAYDRLDNNSPGEQVDWINKIGPRIRSTRSVIEHLWPGMDPEKYRVDQFEQLALMIEYIRRRDSK